MKVIWENAPIASNEVVKRVKQTNAWKDNTIYTLMTRLAKKEMIYIDKDSSPNLCSPLISEKECKREERKSFLKKVYDGSLNLMLANIIEEDSLTESEIKELKSILDQKQNNVRKR
ncbi:penicillinase repressor [Clostridium oryzae]|uniref:Penicillinase repressor n=2 Tax=Clostridium oryzae TaxID=1450648 RepID=A0A1V4IAJ7_9CLOT|nr:penicillinase repressor [Clostridium oryzae]